MKKVTLLYGIGALALASCSNDELVLDTTVDEAVNAPIGFAVSTGNMSRAAGTNATQLSEQHWDFGVWAYKGSGATPAPTILVMENYLVGFYNVSTEKGYKPTGEQKLEGTNYTATPESGYVWYYEGLGNTEKKYTFYDGGTTHTAATAFNGVQYLKYWDRATGTYTWFYAYAPYSLGVSYVNETLKMTFPTLNATTGKDAMYAAEKVENPTTTTTNKYVNLTFYRMLSKVRLAFYEEVEGYHVELYPYSDTYSIPTGDPWTAFGKNAMFVMPAKYDGSEYSTGKYVSEGAPEIIFGGTDYTEPTISFASFTKTDDQINAPLWFFDPSSGTQTNRLGTSRETAIKNETKDVFPQSSDSDCGFTVNLSLKFIAIDTNEEILVRGVRVHIPAADCCWLPNRLYTYYFRVTKNVPGSPSDPGTPIVTPGTDPYLMPIVYDKVTVEAFEDNEVKKPDEGGYGI